MSVIGAVLGSERASKMSGGDPRQPEYWVRKLFGGGADTASGVQVDEDSVLKYSAVWNAVGIIAGAVGFLPLVVYRRLAGEGKERAPDSRIYSLVHDRPNPYMDALTFRETLQAHVLLWGNGYAEIEWDGAARPIALWPLLPNRVQPKLADLQGQKTIIYEVRLSDGKLVQLPYERVLHVKGLGFDGLVGYSVLHYAAEGIGAGIAAERFGAKFFGNGAIPGGVLEHPGKLSDVAEARLRQSWQEMHGGLDQAQRVAILEEGMKYEQIGIPPEDAQFLETRKFGVTDVARWFDVPPHMLKELDRATFSNIEHQGIEFVTWTLMKWLRRWELECNWKLLGTVAYRQYFCEFVTAALLRGDTLSRYQAYREAINAGWLGRNEVRVLENLNPDPALAGFIEPGKLGGLIAPKPAGV